MENINFCFLDEFIIIGAKEKIGICHRIKSIG